MTQPNHDPADGTPSNGCPDPETLALLLDEGAAPGGPGGLDAAERERLETHVAGCPDCLEVLAVAAKALDAEPALPVRRGFSLRRLWPAAAAAGLAFLAAGTWFALSGRVPGPGVENMPVANRKPLPEAKGDPGGVELDGGFLAASGVGDATTLCVQSVGDTTRWALVRGSLFVELGPDAPPVRLITPHATVTVDPGEVHVNVSGNGTDVLVGSGKATVEGRGGKQPLQLTEGQGAQAGPARDILKVARMPSVRVPEWVQTARARHLEEIANEITAGPIVTGGF